MNKMILLAAILCIGCTTANAEVYLNHDIPANSGSYFNNSYTRADVSKIDNNYYMWNNNTQSYDRYTQNNKDIYGSNGSHYKIESNQIKGLSGGSNSYQINNNIIQPLY